MSIGLAAEALAVRRAQYGAVDPALDALLASAPDEPRTVLIWLREPAASKLPERPEAAGKPLEPSEIDRIYAELDARRVEIVAPLVDAVLADVLRFDERAVGLTPTPAIAATLDAKQIGELAGDERIDMIYDAPVATADLGVAKQTTGVTQVHGTGLDGTGVRVGIVEVGGRTESASWLMRPVQQNTTNVCANPTVHTTNVTSVIAGQRVNVFGQIVGEDGVSKRAEVLVGGSCTGVTAELQAAATRAADWGARTINLSWGSDTNLATGGGDRFFDEMVHNRWRTIVKSAGNRNCGNAGGPGGTPDADVTNPGLAYNVITVGGLDDQGTAQWSDDTMYACSSFGDPTSQNGDREKPELVAPAANIEMVDPGPANLAVDSGTSFAAPHVTGVTALLMQQNSRLTFWPEITRAVLMASATHNIEGSTRLSDQDGAGGLAANRASGIVGNTPAWNGVGVQLLDTTHHSTSPRGPWVGARTTAIAISWTTDPAFADYTTAPERRHRPAGGRQPRPHRRHVDELRQHHRDRRVRLVDGRHVHGAGDQLPVRSHHVPRLGVGHVIDAQRPVTRPRRQPPESGRYVGGGCRGVFSSAGLSCSDVSAGSALRRLCVEDGAPGAEAGTGGVSIRALRSATSSRGSRTTRRSVKPAPNASNRR